MSIWNNIQTDANKMVNNRNGRAHRKRYLAWRDGSEVSEQYIGIYRNVHKVSACAPASVTQLFRHMQRYVKYQIYSNIYIHQ